MCLEFQGEVSTRPPVCFHQVGAPVRFVQQLAIQQLKEFDVQQLMCEPIDEYAVQQLAILRTDR